MAFAVRQWPTAPDPRSSLFSFAGWDFSQVAPWQWIVSTTGASGAWAFLNDGFVVPATSDDGFDTQWSGTVPDSGGTTVVLSKFGREVPVAMPPFTLEWLWTIDVPSTGQQGRAHAFILFPAAIVVFGPLAMLDTGVPILDLPNPVKITPAKWDFSLP